MVHIFWKIRSMFEYKWTLQKSFIHTYQGCSTHIYSNWFWLCTEVMRADNNTSPTEAHHTHNGPGFLWLLESDALLIDQPPLAPLKWLCSTHLSLIHDLILELEGSPSAKQLSPHITLKSFAETEPRVAQSHMGLATHLNQCDFYLEAYNLLAT